jgi:predicted outer membrane lipoprotein
LRRWALSVPQVVVLSYGVAFLSGGIGVASMFVRAEIALGLMAATSVLGVIAALWLKRIDMSQPAERACRVEAPVPATQRMP